MTNLRPIKYWLSSHADKYWMRFLYAQGEKLVQLITKPYLKMILFTKLKSKSLLDYHVNVLTPQLYYAMFNSCQHFLQCKLPKHMPGSIW